MKKLLFKNLFAKTKHALFKLYLSTNYTTKKFEIGEDKKALCLAPHQDDETIAMGGTLARFNKNFKVICLTNGAQGFQKNTVSVDVAVSTRKEEFKAAMEVAGIKDFETLDIEDKKLFDGAETFFKIDISTFDYIFLPHPVDQHRDHKAVSVHLYNLLKNAKHKKDLKIMFYEVWSPLTFATKCVNISDFIETKKKMLEAYTSQMAQRSYFEASIGLNKYRGLAKEMNYAEAFFEMDVLDFKKTIESLYEDLIND